MYTSFDAKLITLSSLRSVLLDVINGTPHRTTVLGYSHFGLLAVSPRQILSFVSSHSVIARFLRLRCEQQLNVSRPFFLRSAAQLHLRLLVRWSVGGRARLISKLYAVNKECSRGETHRVFPFHSSPFLSQVSMLRSRTYHVSCFLIR